MVIWQYGDVGDNAPPQDSGNQPGSGNTSSRFFHQHFLTLAMFPLSYCLQFFFGFLHFFVSGKESLCFVSALSQEGSQELKRERKNLPRYLPMNMCENL